MDLTWYGMSCFRLTGRGFASVVTDPYRGKVGLPPLKLKGDVVTISHDASGHNHADAVSNKKHTLNGPGEYEIGGVFVTGIATSWETEEKPNILFLFNFDGLTIAHLGDMKKVPSQTDIEALEQVNILLLPVGGGNSLNAAQAAELVSMLEPNLVVPMHYQIDKLKIKLESVDRFLNEMGVAMPEEEPFLRVTSSSLPVETKVALLSPKI